MRALLTAAGRGTRLGPLTADCPKPMLPISGVPMIERIMDGIAQHTPIREFVLVTGYLASVVEEYFGDGGRWGWRIKYVHQEKPRGLADAVNRTSDLLSDAPFLLTYGDIMLDPINYGGILNAFQRAASARCKATLGVNWTPDPWAGAAVTVDEDYRVRKIQEKPQKGTSSTHWNNAGLFVFDPLLFEYSARVELSSRGEYELTDAVSAMIRDGHYIQGVPISGAWRDVGTPEDYAAVNQEYAERSH